MDWIVSLATFASMLCLARKMWQGWVIGLLNQSLWLWLIFTRDNLYGLLPLAVGLSAVYIWAIWNWTRRPAPVVTQRVVSEMPANVIRLPADDGGERMFRQVPAAVIEHDRATNEPVLLRVISDATAFGDRIELINVLVPEECFTTL